MQHIDPDDLALLAFGEGTEEQRVHLTSCAQCAAEVRSLADVVDLARSGSTYRHQPPPAVWEAIAAAARPETDHGDAAPVPLDTRRRARRGWSTLALVAAAVLGAVLTGGVAWLWPDEDAGVTVANAELDPLTGTVQGATAEVVERDGQRVLRVDTAALPDVEDGYLEVWLIDEQVSGMITVGLLDETQQEFVLPDSVDLASFPIVDVSVEHFDGDPTHSGESLWRGTLPVQG